MLDGIIISSLSTKKSLVAFKAWDKVKGSDFTELNKQIEKCDEIFAKAILCATGQEYELASFNSKEEGMEGMKLWQEKEYYNRRQFNNLTYETAKEGAANPATEEENFYTENEAVGAPKYIAEYLGMTIEEIAEIWGTDYKLESNNGGGWTFFYEDNRIPFWAEFYPSYYDEEAEPRLEYIVFENSWEYDEILLTEWRGKKLTNKLTLSKLYGKPYKFS